MKICFPVTEARGLKSTIYAHFGTAESFVLYDNVKDSYESFSDKRSKTEKCLPLRSLGSRKFDAVIIGGIGGKTIGKLNTMGIKVYRSRGQTVLENLEFFKKGVLKEISAE